MGVSFKRCVRYVISWDQYLYYDICVSSGTERFCYVWQIGQCQAIVMYVLPFDSSWHSDMDFNVEMLQEYSVSKKHHHVFPFPNSSLLPLIRYACRLLKSVHWLVAFQSYKLRSKCLKKNLTLSIDHVPCSLHIRYVVATYKKLPSKYEHNNVLDIYRNIAF